LTDAYQSFGEAAYLQLAIEAASFIESHLMEGARCFRTFKGRRGRTEGYLEDYAHLIQAWVAIYECTFDESWIHKAARVNDYVIGQFRDPADGLFFISPTGGEKLIARKKDLFDNVTPSPNSVMARNLLRLGILLDRDDWKQAARDMTRMLHDAIVKEPVYASNWGIAAMEMSSPFFETVIAGPRAKELLNDLQRNYHPFNLCMGTTNESTLPLVKGRAGTKETWIHVCVDNSCQLPVKSAAEAMQLLSSRSQ
jgi:hypothetical protein